MSERNHQFFRLGIVSHQRYFTLQSSTETDVAVLNSNISRCFRDLETRAPVNYEGFVDANTWQDLIQTWKKTVKAGVMSVDINIYGSRNDSHVVGKVFSKAKLYFQHPHHCDSGVKYENPHYLSLPNISGLKLENPSASVTPVRTASILSGYNIPSVLDGLHQHENLFQVELDYRIKATLRRFCFLS